MVVSNCGEGRRAAILSSPLQTSDCILSTTSYWPEWITWPTPVLGAGDSYPTPAESPHKVMGQRAWVHRALLTGVSSAVETQLKAVMINSIHDSYNSMKSHKHGSK